nr:MAG TPA: hypothetical protein [Caudoviricetes sp.]
MHSSPLYECSRTLQSKGLAIPFSFLINLKIFKSISLP